MLTILLMGLVGSCVAAPFSFQRGSQYNYYGFSARNNEPFDLGQIRSEFFTSLSSVAHFPVDVNENEYQIAIPLEGFEESDVTVQVTVTGSERYLTVVAMDMKSEVMQSYTTLLPTFVKIPGRCSFKDGVLTVKFPVRESPVSEVPVTDAPTAGSPEQENIAGGIEQEHLFDAPPVPSYPQLKLIKLPANSYIPTPPTYYLK